MNHFVFSSFPANLPVMSGQPVPVRRGAARHDGCSSWILIDLDAACRISEAAGQKLTSSAFYPPEMARYELQKDAGAQPPAAMVVLEMWYFGLMVLQVTLCHSLSHRPPSGDTQMH